MIVKILLHKNTVLMQMTTQIAALRTSTRNTAASASESTGTEPHPTLSTQITLDIVLILVKGLEDISQRKQR